MSRSHPTRPDPAALRRTLGAIRPHLRRYRSLMIGGLIALFAEAVLRVLEPWPLKVAIDAVSASLGATSGANAGTAPATIGLLVGCGLAILGLVAFRAVAGYLSTIAFALAGSRVATELRARVFAHVQALSLRYHAVRSAGDTVQRLVGDIGRLQEVAVTAGLPLVGNVVTLVVLSIVMLWMDPLLTVVVVAAALLYLLASHRSSRAITSAARTTRKGEGALADTAGQTLGAIRVVQAYGLEEEIGGAFARGNATALKQGVKAKRLAASLERRTDVIAGAATALVVAGGGWRALEGEMTPGDLVVFIMYLKIAMRPLKDLAKYTGRIASAAASGERVAELLDEQVEVCDSPNARPLNALQGAIAFENVSVDDGYGRPLISDLSLRIRAGENVCLLGPSGSGKSTLVSLLVRAADPRSGSIRIDGTDLRDATLASLRSQVSIVLQDSVLFATTVHENIRYGRLDATDAEVEEAARRAKAHDFITALPDGYETVLGDRGGTLSGGQRQRVAIARALLRDAPIVLLDEATTGLDPESCEQVIESVAALTRGRTTISITHNPVSIAGADRLLWLEDCRIVEDGAPAELLARDSRVAAWFRGGMEPAEVRP